VSIPISPTNQRFVDGWRAVTISRACLDLPDCHEGLAWRLSVWAGIAFRAWRAPEDYRQAADISLRGGLPDRAGLARGGAVT
jgi:hypothetical protein